MKLWMSDVYTDQINSKKKELGKCWLSPEAWKRPSSLASYRTEPQKIPTDVHASCSQNSH